MFDFFDKKTKKNIMCTIIITLIFEFIAIFISYSSLQVKEYLVRAENTAKQNSRYIDLCMNHYENSISFLIKNHSDKFKNANQIELYYLFREFMISNTNISNIFFYNDELTASYDNLPSRLNGYISNRRQAVSGWDLFNNCLLYSSPIQDDGKFYGNLVIYVSDNTLISYSQKTNFEANSNIVTLLHSPNDIKPLTDADSQAEYSRTNLFTHINNTPLEEKGISVVNIIFISEAYKRIIILGTVLGVILIISAILAYYCINKYNTFLVTRLKQLSSAISGIPHNLSKEEIQHETFKQHKN